MGHAACVLRELSLPEPRHVLDTLHSSRIHVCTEFLQGRHNNLVVGLLRSKRHESLLTQQKITITFKSHSQA